MDNGLNKDSLVKIPITTLFPGRYKDIDMYLVFNDRPVLYKEAKIPISKEKLAHLYESGITHVLIKKEDLNLFVADLEKEFHAMLNREEPSVHLLKKSFEVLGAASEFMLVVPERESLKSAESMSEEMTSFVEKNPKAAYLVAFTLKKDFKISVHLTNVYYLSLGFAYHLGYRGNDLKRIAIGGFFHDIGKSKLPNNIVKRGGILGPEEVKIYETHTILGYEILKENDLDEYAFAAYEHHELLDGSGYPRGLKRDEIRRETRVIQICNIYDTLTGFRYHKTGEPPFNALVRIRDDFVLKGKMDKYIYAEFVNFLYKNRTE
ncbi:metal dependent phosphohydrolase [Thermosulfidibacter takaii ABI70S6]|uniref:Metal dependent phosphohydrolase n=1 Tax=Thermosulfidibacter takaii (strain DSM 17441 / JCM 13301 / NBRC 103674 / ABI70S6) TaxID=1298851 RepID=A0A0S3QT85_THET7|nr:HD domain-containing phosphohydrolase [Thermosulfidibacter takaii]BAT71540.1 metal dependent phosphohydrolase [Thermosulfidibacter takaii ABI70S6]